MLTRPKATVASGEAAGETIVWDREWRVYEALRPILGDEPCNFGGKYSWLTSPISGRPLQIDLFFTSIVQVDGVPISRERTLAVEVQSSLHDGKWTRAKRRFFRTKEDFERYTRNQASKKTQLERLGIPLLEIDPSTDDMSESALRKVVYQALGLRKGTTR